MVFFLDQLHLPYKFLGSSIRGIPFFRFASCEPLIKSSLQLFMAIQICIVCHCLFFLAAVPGHVEIHWVIIKDILNRTKCLWYDNRGQIDRTRFQRDWLVEYIFLKDFCCSSSFWFADRSAWLLYIHDIVSFDSIFYITN